MTCHCYGRGVSQVTARRTVQTMVSQELKLPLAKQSVFALVAANEKGAK